MTQLEFSVLDVLDHAAVDEWSALLDYSNQVDSPDYPPGAPAARVMGLLRSAEAVRFDHILARRDGQLVGTAEMIMPRLDNEHLVEFELEVHPDHRRSGVGAALLAEVERRGREAGRRTFIVYTPVQVEGGPARTGVGARFAEANGYEAGLDEIQRVIDLSTVDQAEVDRLLAEAWQKAADYDLVQWVSRAPNDVVDAVAYLDGRLNLDAPIGDLEMEQAKVDAARIRDQERNRVLRGQQAFNTALRHRETGTLAGWTDIVVNGTDEINCWQGTTIVDPDHRGKRIGTILKIENLRLVGEYRPKMRMVRTWNAESNAHMININEAVGYRAVDRWIAFQKKFA
ncbi:acetyltransferase (GNAT) family protein [Stackebrandtia endophytica]|uniref:Acetyltransferase (GNAT) family protein n=1 Tax=Stackebrandtia endophytica TaxID=1496996 RepID=A0A543AWL3_9ACTN|nr:GNAT family N-acetyltransferase [Stackebrandtia endophytica]TQL76963.1 acetyltransferase (GNAT) family protein [Stackebrandtia endophytica]